MLFTSVVTTAVFQEMAKKNAHFTGKVQSSMVTGLMFPVCGIQQLWEGGLKNLVTSLSLQFSLLRLLSDRKIRSLFHVTDSKHVRISRISGMIVRLANEELTYSGIYSYSRISQKNVPSI